jgi:hypothetical protein
MSRYIYISEEYYGSERVLGLHLCSTKPATPICTYLLKIMLYHIVRHKNDTIATVMESSPSNVTFKRNLLGPKLVSYNVLFQRLATV